MGIDTATLAALREKYRRDEVDLCPSCGKTLQDGPNIRSDGSAALYCPDHPARITRLLKPGDPAVLVLLDAYEALVRYIQETRQESSDDDFETMRAVAEVSDDSAVKEACINLVWDSCELGNLKRQCQAALVAEVSP